MTPTPTSEIPYSAPKKTEMETSAKVVIAIIAISLALVGWKIGNVGGQPTPRQLLYIEHGVALDEELAAKAEYEASKQEMLEAHEDAEAARAVQEETKTSMGFIQPLQ